MTNSPITQVWLIQDDGNDYQIDTTKVFLSPKSAQDECDRLNNARADQFYDHGLRYYLKKKAQVDHRRAQNAALLAAGLEPLHQEWSLIDPTEPQPRHPRQDFQVVDGPVEVVA